MRRWPTLAIVALMVLFALWAIPHQRRQTDIKRTQACVTNVKLIGIAILQYVADHDDTMPIMSAYPEALLRYPPLTRANLACPADPEQAMPGYAYCRVWAGVKHGTTDSPSCAVMLYEASGGQLAYRHRLGYRGETKGRWGEPGPFIAVGYADGREEQGTTGSFTMQNVLTGRDADYLGSHPDLAPAGQR